MSTPELAWEVAVPARAELAEHPVWDPAGECLIWVDINAGQVHRFREGTGDEVVADIGVPVGAAIPRRAGGYVLAAADGFRLTGTDGSAAAGPLRPAGMPEDVRFNDGACDQAGRFWAGTVALDGRGGAGALYRLDPDGSVALVLDGVTESNGLGWSADGRTFYYIDSGELEPRVRAFGHEPATGRHRDIAMVFQSYALYPHLSVYDNMAFSLKYRKVSKAEIRQRVTEAARILELEPYLHRKPRQLSGGQRQRVAMGRAIVRQPRAFLMDEPLSNLDSKLRVQMRAEIAQLQRSLGTTTIYVTHDQTEAMTLGTRVAVLQGGVLQQVATPQELYSKPASCR